MLLEIKMKICEILFPQLDAISSFIFKAVLGFTEFILTAGTFSPGAGGGGDTGAGAGVWKLLINIKVSKSIANIEKLFARAFLSYIF